MSAPAGEEEIEITPVVGEGFLVNDADTYDGPPADTVMMSDHSWYPLWSNSSIWLPGAMWDRVIGVRPQ